MTKREYQSLIIPQLSWDKKKLSNTFGELVAQPLEPGFGITLGNALRRTLLGGIEGSAVTSVIVKGINNEFSTIPGVIEDAMQLILNIKGIVIRNKEGIPGTMHLHSKGESTVHVADIKADAYLELVNPEHVLAHLGLDGELDITFFVESGRGYQPARWPTEKGLQEDGRIYLDAMFSPIQRVAYDVEKTRVGGEIDYDKLILRIYTDGSESPVDMLHYAVSVLRTQLENFLVSVEIPFNEISEVSHKEEEKVIDLEDLGLRGVSLELLLKPIDELELSVRAHNCLLNANISRILDLVNLNEDDLLKIKNFGRKSLNEVKENLKGFGLSFGMNIKESDIEKILKSKQEQDS
jgi:DNA-directed RNA polymerase subunit alpha